ncbi:MAG: tRNA (guanosine(37)-N1)-methyltransferase TrmD [Candidatus Paceibacterota bacterium]|jgi:tRNA (guanine37-N1)-methyltransferase
MRFNILTIFPEIWPEYLKAGILGRAQEDKLVEMAVINIRDFTTDKHRTVDDSPYGGGAGMVLKIEPIAKAIDSINFQFSKTNFQTIRQLADQIQETETPRRRIIVLSARGEQFTQAKAEEYAKLDELVLICGRYEGIDQRVADYLADEEISIGPYVLNGGEVAAMVVIEAVARLLPGVLGNEESLKEESYSQKIRNPPASGGTPPDGGGKSINPKPSLRQTLRRARQNRNSKSLNSKRVVNPESQKDETASSFTVEYPQYTKPAEYKGWKVPEVLLSGNHEEIRKWREGQKKKSAR